MHLAQVKRLGDVVIGADLEADDPVDDIVAARQHHDRHIGLHPDFPRQVQAVLPAGKREVEKDRVEIRLLHAQPHVASVAGATDAIPFVLEVSRQHVADA